MKKTVAIIIISLLLLPSFISASQNEKSNEYKECKQHYTVYKRTFLVLGIRDIRGIFTTPSDCKELKVEAKVGPYFTGQATIYIRNEGDPRHAYHTIWGTGYYILVWSS
ncbi:MAG: hypothetical protein DRN29_01515 [Thermoplasmata archaeon]|nr:MAG: hypothetical protein DRN29_01515 [Thermoplasmata archaeon]